MSYIYKRKDGRFEGRQRVGSKENGQPHFRYVYARTYEECKQKLENIQPSAEAVSLNVRPLLFRQAAERWLSFVETYVKKSTYAAYRYVLEHHILHVFGGVHLENFSEEQVRNFLNRLQDRGLSMSTVRNIAVIIRLVLAFAERQYNQPNFLRGLRLPRIQRIRETFSSHEWRKLRTNCVEETSTTATAVALAAYLGLRIGEVCALKVKDFDKKRKTLSICRTVQRVYQAHGKKRTVLIAGLPKSGHSCRILPVPEALSERLKELSRNLEGDSWFFGRRGKPLEPRTLQYRFKKYLSSLGLQPRGFHQLRHRFAGHCVEKNINIKALSEILGHSSVRITLDYYVHPSMDYKRRQLERLAKVS